MILTVSGDRERRLSLAGVIATAMCGAQLTQPFPSEAPGQDLPFRPAPVGGGGIQVQCQVAAAPFVKAGFVAVGFYVREATGPATIPVKNNLLNLTVSPAAPPEKYPDGPDDTGRVTTVFFCAAGLTRLLDNGDPYSGDPGHSMLVRCDSSDVPRVKAGFGANRISGPLKRERHSLQSEFHATGAPRSHSATRDGFHKIAHG